MRLSKVTKSVEKLLALCTESESETMMFNGMAFTSIWRDYMGADRARFERSGLPNANHPGHAAGTRSMRPSFFDWPVVGYTIRYYAKSVKYWPADFCSGVCD